MRCGPSQRCHEGGSGGGGGGCAREDDSAGSLAPNTDPSVCVCVCVCVCVEELGEGRRYAVI